MAVTVADRVLWNGATISTDGVAAVYACGDLLPEATTDDDVANRATLRAGGAIQSVTVVTTEAEFTAAALEAATAAAEREAIAAGTDAAKPVLLAPDGLAIVADY